MTYFKRASYSSSSELEYYQYSLNGDKLTLSRRGNTYFGYVKKLPSQNKIFISQGLDGTVSQGNIPTKMCHYYDYSSFEL